MAITVADLKFFTAERMTDNDDGGGQMTGTEIVSGNSNQIFDDLSDVDRSVGDASIRKIYAAVTSADTDKYLDSGVVVFREPTDPNVSVLAFSTGDYYDERLALKNRIEQTISRGARWNGWLWGQHLVGQRVIVLWQRTNVAAPAQSARMELVAKSSGAESFSQFVWVTRVTESVRTMYYSGTGGAPVPYAIKEVICEIAEPLEYAFVGNDPSPVDPSSSSADALIYDTRYNANAVPMFGIQPTIAEAVTTDYSIKIASLYSPLIPTAFAETALADINPGGDSATLVSGNSSTISFTTTAQVIKADVSLYLGSGAMPGTVSISVSGATLTDDNGVMKRSGSEIGTIDYGNGVIRWNSSVTNYGTAAKVVTFKPAAKPLRVADTASQAVTIENRGFVWVMTLSPIPAPQTLRVSYRVNNVWYVIYDQGGGQLTGVDSSYGSGNLNFSTGTVMMTTGALPDVDSEIIYAWGTPVNYTSRGGDPVDAPVVRGQTENTGVAPGSVSVSWTVGQTTYTIDDDPANDGNLTGTGGVGFIRYATGEWWVRPTTLPPVNTDFTIAYDYGDPVEETFTDPSREGNGHLVLVLQDIPREGTVEVEWHTNVLDYEAYTIEEKVVDRPRDPIQISTDRGDGTFDIPGGTDGVIVYATKTVDFLPDFTTTIPKGLYSTVAIGTKYENIPGNTTQRTRITTYRHTFIGYEWIPAGSTFPIQGGIVKVRYRVAGGDTSASEVVTLSSLNLDLTKGYGETISLGSSRFRIGTDTFVETAGQIYRNPALDTGAGSLAGTLDRSTGRVYLSQWTGGITNAITLDSLVTELAGQPVDEVTFRTPVSPIKSGTLQLRYTTLDGVVKSKSVDATGILEDADCLINVDYPLGVVRARFGLWKLDSALTPAEKLEDWYSTDYLVDFGGTLKIWKSTLVLADSIIYNAVAQTFLPPDSTLLGLNAARLPPDGKALIYSVGNLALVHHTDSFAESSLSPTQVLDCQRVRLYRAVIEDVDGQRLLASFYAVNRELGTITMAANLDLTGYTGPYTVIHTVADLARIVETDINGTLTFNRPLSHTYPADESRVSSLLFTGTLQARYTGLFAQSTWTSVWSDMLIGTEPLAQYNDTAYPVIVSNLGAYKDRILVKFTSSTDFQVFGENLGLIGIGDTSHNCAPVNTLTGQPYFTIDYHGWGLGWATGNCLRFNLIGANYPVDLIRAVQPSNPTGLDDSVELLFVGNVDA